MTSSACVCSLLRLSYSIKLLRSTDLTYILSLNSIWGHLEIGFGITVACLPGSAKFFQALSGSRCVTKVRCWLKLLLEYISTEIRRGTDDCRADNHTALNLRHSQACPEHYMALSDEQQFAKRSSNTSIPVRSSHQSSDQQAYILRTIDIEAHGEQNNHKVWYSTDSEQCCKGDGNPQSNF